MAGPLSAQEQLRNQSASAILAGEFDADQVLLPYQRRWIADTSQLKIAEKSRRTGLTWAEAAEAALSGSMSPEAGGTDTFYVGTTKDMAREFIDACAMWAKAYNLAASAIGEEALEDDDKDILVYVINFASGFKIKALSSNPSNLRGMQGNVIIDEAAFQKDLAAVLKAALALTMDNPVKETARTAAAANFLSAECFIVFLPFCYGFFLRRPARNLSMKKMQSFLCIHYTAIKLQLKIVIFHGSLFSFCIPLDR